MTGTGQHWRTAVTDLAETAAWAPAVVARVHALVEAARREAAAEAVREERAMVTTFTGRLRRATARRLADWRYGAIAKAAYRQACDDLLAALRAREAAR